MGALQRYPAYEFFCTFPFSFLGHKSTMLNDQTALELATTALRVVSLYLTANRLRNAVVFFSFCCRYSGSTCSQSGSATLHHLGRILHLLHSELTINFRTVLQHLLSKQSVKVRIKLLIKKLKWPLLKLANTFYNSQLKLVLFSLTRYNQLDQIMSRSGREREIKSLSEYCRWQLVGIIFHGKHQTKGNSVWAIQSNWTITDGNKWCAFAVQKKKSITGFR